MRWPVGEEPYPDTPGTSKDDPWVNLKLDITEHLDPGPNQKGLLHGGPALKMKCVLCGMPLHVAAEMSAQELLEKGGFRLKKDTKLPEEKVCACVCQNGHVIQLRETFVKRLLKREDDE